VSTTPKIITNEQLLTVAGSAMDVAQKVHESKLCNLKTFCEKDLTKNICEC